MDCHLIQEILLSFKVIVEQLTNKLNLYYFKLYRVIKRTEPNHIMNFHLETTAGANYEHNISEIYYRHTIYYPIIDTIIKKF